METQLKKRANGYLEKQINKKQTQYILMYKTSSLLR